MQFPDFLHRSLHVQHFATIQLEGYQDMDDCGPDISVQKKPSIVHHNLDKGKAICANKQPGSISIHKLGT